MSSGLAAILQTLLFAALQLRHPVALSPEPQPAREPDPAYVVYERYRYAYDKYGYLFLDEGTDLAGGDGDAVLAGGGADGTGNAAGNIGANGTGNAAGNIGADGMGSTAGSGGAAEGAEGSKGALSQETLAQLQDYDYLMKHFYSVHASTTADRELMKADMLLGTELKLEKNPSVPQILIYHTHSQETYADYGPENPDATVTANGAYLAELLRAKGWNVIHDASAYDIQGGKLDRSKAYNYALDGITGILQANPTIEVVLDLHRDGVKEGTRLVSQVNGKPTAKIMFFQGMSRTPEGAIEYLPNPNLKENMAFAFQLQLAADQLYPGYTRKIYLKGLRYNLHLRGRSSLIEVGAQTNTSQEALNAMEPLAELLDMVLQGK